ncbi:uncharacterized protein B0H18DRAFT_1123174 [Fomitopsis serialis]|uniref:uncharacterized protein n=1 Tax=Fomitopsis serialis TaxID=139415 RepID=UPI002008299A|nr:uncharacterized protein B0H18DRAFT_1123174 [Neoantrodia serialis]KAH9918134.1 hypothetical protein B0H18DRAFT_1123174 [Neoantrodia serialis]
MAPIARTVELVGVGAYLGLPTSFQTLRSYRGCDYPDRRGTPSDDPEPRQRRDVHPQAFDIALTPNEVLAIAGSFISGCSTGIASNAALSITNTGAIVPGTKLASRRLP